MFINIFKKKIQGPLIPKETFSQYVYCSNCKEGYLKNIVCVHRDSQIGNYYYDGRTYKIEVPFKQLVPEYLKTIECRNCYCIDVLVAYDEQEINIS